MSKKIWVAKMIAQIVEDSFRSKQTKDTANATAEIIVDRLVEEGVLNLGYGNADIDRVVQKFVDTFETTKVSRYDRFAARRLADKHSSQAVCGIIEMLGENSQKKYAPIVRSVSQLEEKWVSVVSFLRKESEDEVIDVG